MKCLIQDWIAANSPEAPGRRTAWLLIPVSFKSESYDGFVVSLIAAVGRSARERRPAAPH
jgi:hypothetical protein